MPVLAIVLSLISAPVVRMRAVAQQTAAAAVLDARSPVSVLVSSTRWWAGVVGDGGGCLVQVTALSRSVPF